MLRLRTFGRVAVERDGVVLGGAAGQRRVLALLTVLATAGERGMSRDALLALLWSEKNPERARQALTQALYHARRAIGAEDALPAGPDLRLDPAIVSSDVADFEEAVRQDDLERAAALYEGPFLDGFFVTGAPEFERWASSQRSQLADRYGQVLERLATARERANDWPGAVEWRKQLAALDPLRTSSAIALMDALAASGDRAAALRHARVHEALLREELDLEPDATFTAAVERLRSEPPAAPVAATGSSATGSTAATGERRTIDGDEEPAPDGTESASTRSDVPAAEAHDAIEAPEEALDDDDGERISTALSSVVIAPPGGQQAVRVLTPAARRRRRITIGLGALLLTVVAGLVVRLRREPPPVVVPAPRARVVVAPFRVAGASNELHYLREGLIDLLATKLSEDDTTLAADPGAVMSVWRRAGVADSSDVARGTALALTRQLGAERLVMGGVVGTARRMAISAWVLDAKDGSLTAQATVEGTADSLTSLVDRLAVGLLLAESGEQERLSRRTTTSLPALRALLDARSAYRRGRYRDAVRDYRRALDRDTSFAMAALGLAGAAERLGMTSERDRGIAVAWSARAELSARDASVLDAMAGPAYPLRSSWRAHLRAWEHATDVAPNRPESWLGLGETLLHRGDLLGIPDPLARAYTALARARELDPGSAPAIQDLVLASVRSGDSAAVRRFAREYATIDSTGDLSPFVQWSAAAALGDRVMLARARQRVRGSTVASARLMALVALQDALLPGDADRALDARLAQTARSDDRADLLRARHALAVARGRPAQAARWLDDLRAERDASSSAFRLTVLDALFDDGDSAAAERAAVRLAAVGDAITPRSLDVCVAGLWASSVRRLGEARAMMLRLQATDSAAADITQARACAGLLEATLAVESGRADAAARLAALDTSLVDGPALGEMWDFVPLAVSRLHERAGSPRRALQAVRRRPHMMPWPAYVAANVLQEARLSSALADTSAAARGYRKYLELRADAEPSMAAAVDSVRASLAQLAQPR